MGQFWKLSVGLFKVQNYSYFSRIFLLEINYIFPERFQIFSRNFTSTLLISPINLIKIRDSYKVILYMIYKVVLYDTYKVSLYETDKVVLYKAYKVIL